MAGLVVEVKSNRKADNFLAALINYNKSLCFAETSEVKSLAYANRSVVYLETKKYQHCLENIQLARKHGYPEEKSSKLDEREVKCRDLMKDHQTDPLEDPWNFFKLSYPAKEKLPFIADCLELKEDPKYGRLIATNRDLKPGDIVLIEEPWFKFLSLNHCYERCSNCTKENMLSLIPCNGRCVNTMYCSVECANAASFRHRPIECGLPMPELITQKLVFDSTSIAGGMKELLACIEANEKLTIFDIDMTNPEDPQVKKQQLMAFLNLNVVPEQLEEVNKLSFKEIGKLLQQGLSQNLPLEVHQNMPYLPEMHINFWNSPGNLSKVLEPFAELTFRLELIGLNVTKDVKLNIEFPECGHPKYEVMEYGSPILLCGALFNHSCDPNVGWCVVENKFVAVVRYPIKAGEQLFVCYRDFFVHEPLGVRRKVLLKECQFFCECNACINDYTFSNERAVDDNSEIVRATKLNPSELFAEFKKNCDCIQKNFQNHPCHETVFPNILNQMLLDRISSFGYFKGSLELLANKRSH